MGSVRDRPDDDGGEPSAEERRSGASGGGGAFADEARSGTIDARTHAAWRAWLGALASDSKAALAAALAYEALPSGARDAWLEALDADAPGVHVPKVALYAPLLAVESDAGRRARIEQALAADPPRDTATPHALRGATPSGETVCVVVSPLYLDFVELLICRFGPGGISSARHVPLSHLRDDEAIPEADGAPLELAPFEAVIEELAHAVVAHRRAGAEPPEALRRVIHLFAPPLGSEDE